MLWWNRMLYEGVMLPVSETLARIPLLTGHLMASVGSSSLLLWPQGPL